MIQTAAQPLLQTIFAPKAKATDHPPGPGHVNDRLEIASLRNGEHVLSGRSAGSASPTRAGQTLVKSLSCEEQRLVSARSLMAEGALLMRVLSGFRHDTVTYAGMEAACERSAFTTTLRQIVANGRTDSAVSSSLIMREACVRLFSPTSPSPGGMLFRAPLQEDVIAVGESDINSKPDDTGGYYHGGEEGLTISGLARRYLDFEIRDRERMNEVLCVLREPVGLFIPEYNSRSLDASSLAQLLEIQSHLQHNVGRSLPIFVYQMNNKWETSGLSLLSQEHLDEAARRLERSGPVYPTLTCERYTELAEAYARQFLPVQRPVPIQVQNRSVF